MSKQEIGIGGLLLALLAAGLLCAPSFHGAANLTNLLNLIGLYGIFSLGMGLVIITGGIDLSVGSLFALLGVLLVDALRTWAVPWPLAVAGVIALGAGLGLVHGLLVTRLRLPPFIVTLCGLLLYRGLARFLSDDQTRGFGGDGFASLRFLATGKLLPGLFGWSGGGWWMSDAAPVGIPMPFALLLAVALAVWVLLHRSVYGRYLFAIGRNEEAARYAGVDTGLVIATAYALCLGLAAVSAILIAFYTNAITPSTHGNFFELYGIAAAVLGGCRLAGGEGSVLGILIGTAVILVLRNLVTLLGIPSSLEYAVMGTVILLGVISDRVLSRKTGNG